MIGDAATSRSRCLVVAAGLTAALWGAAAVLVREAAAGAVGGPVEAGVGRLCLVAVALATVWGWLQGLAGVVDAWVGAPPSGTAVRRMALAACGAALVGALAAPTQAADLDVDGPDVLTGLPLPERAEGPAHPQPRRPEVTVRRGDSLWLIAVRDLGGHPSDVDISVRWQQVYAANRAVIGPDPDLVRPGQVLTLRTVHHP
jgi:hypothetical protein